MPPKPTQPALDPSEAPTRRVREPLPATVEQLPRLIGLRDPALVNHVLEQSARINELDTHIVEIEASMVLGFARLERKMDGETLPPRAHHDMRRPLPSFSGYNPEYTPAGGIKLDPDEFEKLQRHVADQDRRAELAEAEAKGAAKALADVEAKAAKSRAEAKEKAETTERRQRRVLFILAILGAAASVATYCIGHFHP